MPSAEATATVDGVLERQMRVPGLIDGIIQFAATADLPVQQRDIAR